MSYRVPGACEATLCEAMAPYWAGTGRASSASSAAPSGPGSLPAARKTSSAGEAYHRVVGLGQGLGQGLGTSTRNPLYGMHGLHGGSVAGSASASDDTTATSSSSRHYVDPWDLENFMYLKRHWADEEPPPESSSTPAIEIGAQSDFYYVGPSPGPCLDHGPDLDVDLDMDVYPGPRQHYRPDSVLLAEEPPSLGLLNAVEEEHFFNERYDASRHRLVRRSQSAAATYLHHRDELNLRTPTHQLRAATRVAHAHPALPAHHAHPAHPARRRSVACAPRYYRTPITGGGEYTDPQLP